MSPLLPSLRPLDPAWPLVAVITLVGGAITTAIAGSTTIPLLCLTGAVAAALVVVRLIRSHSIVECKVDRSEPNE